MNPTQITSLFNIQAGSYARYSFKLSWIDYLAETGSMKHKQDLSISL